MVDISTIPTALRNTIAMNEISNVLWAWRAGQIDTDQSTRKIDAIVKEYREDIY
jgi:hypothetical protein